MPSARGSIRRCSRPSCRTVTADQLVRHTRTRRRSRRPPRGPSRSHGSRSSPRLPAAALRTTSSKSIIPMRAPSPGVNSPPVQLGAEVARAAGRRSPCARLPVAANRRRAQRVDAQRLGPDRARRGRRPARRSPARRRWRRSSSSGDELHRASSTAGRGRPRHRPRRSATRNSKNCVARRIMSADSGEQIAARLLAAATNLCADTAVVVVGRVTIALLGTRTTRDHARLDRGANHDRGRARFDGSRPGLCPHTRRRSRD